MKLPFLLGVLVFSAKFIFPVIVFAHAAPCAETQYVEEPDVVVAEQAPSWIFRRSTYSHDPYTGARVAQYMRTPPVEPLDDPRMVTSRYRRSRTNLRGTDGSFDTYYEVQSWGNGRGGIDAEWERFHDAWKDSYLQGGFYNQGPSTWHGGPWGHGGFAPGFGHGQPWFGFPGNWHGGGPWQGGNPWGGGHGGGNHGGSGGTGHGGGGPGHGGGNQGGSGN